MKSSSSKSDDAPGWFDRKENVQKLLLWLYVGCGLFVLIDILFRVFGFDKHPYFRWEEWPGFYAVYSFVASVLLVLGAKYILRPLVKRREDFYEKETADTAEKGGPNDA